MFALQSEFVKPQKNEVDFADALLDLIDCGFLMCDHRGTLIYANRAAQRELAAGESLELRAGAIRCREELGSELARVLNDAAVKRRARLMSLGEGRKRLTIVALPFASRDLARPVAVLMIGPRTPCSPLGLAMLGARHRLTLAEERVLEGLVNGMNPREIAHDQLLCLPTIRTHIQSIREKIGVRSIDELLILIARIPPVCTFGCSSVVPLSSS
jgi:DNA-binding CsgD family transcriptional regulator